MDRLSLSVDSASVDFGVDLGRSNPSVRRLTLRTSTTIINNTQVVVVTYTDLTAADDAHDVLQDATGNDVASFTTGQGDVPAVTNRSTQGTDTTAPTLTSATVNADGDQVTLVFSEPFTVPFDASAFYTELASRLGLTVDSASAAFAINTTTSDPSAGRLVLAPKARISTDQAVVVTYTDLTSGDDASNVLQDAAGNDVATFTTGQSSVPAVTNHSTRTPDTTPPALTSATVDATGKRIDLIFDESFDVPADAAAFYTALAGRLALSVKSASAAFTIDATASNAVARRLVLTPKARISTDQAVVVTYTDLTSGDDASNVLQDAAGNDVATFTTGQGGVPAVTNNSTQVPDTTTPVLTSATVDATGKRIDLIFDESFDVPADAAAFYTALAGRLALSVESASAAFTIDATASDPSTGLLVLTPTATIYNGEAVVITYTDLTTGDDADNVLQDAAGNDVATFTTGQGGVPAVISRSTVTNPPPVFADDVTTFTVEENATSGTVGTVTATDEDGDPLTYSVSGSDASAFDRDFNLRTTGGSGVIDVRPDADIDFETRPSYSVRIIAADPTGGTDSIAVTITVTNADDPGRVILSTSQPRVGVAMTATLTDPDGGVTGATWAWASGASRSGDFTGIAGADAASYTPVAADEHRYLRATVTYTDAFGSGKSAQAVSVRGVTVRPPTQPSIIAPYWTDGDGSHTAHEHSLGNAMTGSCTGTQYFRGFWSPPSDPDGGVIVPEQWEVEAVARGGVSNVTYAVSDEGGQPEYPQLLGEASLDGAGSIRFRVRGNFGGGEGWGEWSPPSALYCFEE